MGNFSVLKFKNGDTIFCEAKLERGTSYITIDTPYQITPFLTDSGAEILQARKWIPYTSMGQFIVPTDAILLVAPLSEAYVRFYGTTTLKYNLHELYVGAANRISDNEDKIEVIESLYSDIQIVYDQIYAKFGDLDFDLEGFKTHVTQQLNLTEENTTVGKSISPIVFH